jgi:hypothetical protein
MIWKDCVIDAVDIQDEETKRSEQLREIFGIPEGKLQFYKGDFKKLKEIERLKGKEYQRVSELSVGWRQR